MNVLTISHPYDFHALAVKWGLHLLGVENEIWFPRDFPFLQKGTVTLNEGASASVMITTSETVIRQEYGVVWRRRVHRPLAHPQTHRHDLDFANGQNLDFARLAEGVLAENAIVLNPFEAHWLVEHKIRQMAVAQQCGLRIADTIVSNDADDIRRFVRHHGERVVYKPLRGGTWKSSDNQSASVLFTTSISLADVQDDLSLAITPGIYQRKLEKQYELRVTVMGSTAIAVRIDSLDAACDKDDWRAGQLNGKPPPMQACVLPPALAQKCVDTVQGLGLLFGCIDLIVTPEDEVFFVENNSMGQFLWCEACPGSFLLDPFCRFLTRPTRDFCYHRPAEPITFQGYLASSFHRATMAKTAAEKHVALPRDWTDEDIDQ